MAIRVPYNEQKVDIAPIRIAQARPDTAGAAAGQALAKGIASIGQVAEQAADYEFRIKSKEQEELNRAELDRYEQAVNASAGLLQADILKHKEDKVRNVDGDDLPTYIGKRFKEDAAKITIPDYLKTKADSIVSRIGMGLNNKATAHYVHELDKWKESQQQAAIALKTRQLAEVDFSMTDEVKAGLDNLTQDLGSRFSGDRLAVEKQKYIGAALFQQAENAIDADPDNLQKVKDADHFKTYLTKEQFQKLEDHAKKRNVEVVTKAKDDLFNTALLQPMMDKQIINLKEISQDPRYLKLVEKDATQALAVAKTISAHNENTATDNVMGWIATQRATGRKITNWQQISKPIWDPLMQEAPAKANALMERFDAEKEIRSQSAAAAQEQRQYKAALLADTMMNPEKLDKSMVVAQMQAGIIDPDFGMKLLKASEQAGDTLGKLKQGQLAAAIQDEAEALTAGITDTKKRDQAKKKLMGDMFDVLSGAFGSTLEINKDTVNLALQRMRSATLQTKGGVFSKGKTVNAWEVGADDKVVIDPRDTEIVGMLSRRYGMTEAQAAARAAQLRQTGQDPRRSLFHRR